MGSIVLDKTDGVATLTVDSPEVRNGLTPQMGRELVAACEDIDADPQIGAAVVRGAEGTFCSGVDRRTWKPGADQTEDSTFRDTGAVYRSFVRVGNLEVPTIAAVRGAAVGAGINLMLATDLRIVAEDARLLAGFLRIGLHPGGGHFVLLSRLAGREAAAAMALGGAEIDGDRAVALGLAWESVDDGAVEARAMEFAAGVAKDPALARAAVRSFRMETGPPAVGWDTAVQTERAPQMWSMRRRSGGR